MNRVDRKKAKSRTKIARRETLKKIIQIVLNRIWKEARDGPNVGSKVFEKTSEAF